MHKGLPDRRGAVLSGAFAAAFLVAQQVAGRATRDALFLTHYPAAALPAVMMASSLASVASALGVARLLAVRAPRQAVPALVGLNAGLLLALFLLASVAPSLAAVLIYLQLAATGATLISGYWSVVNEQFDPWTAKRVVGRLGLGASLGGVVGGLLAWTGAGAIPVPAMLLVMAALNVAALVSLVRFSGGVPVAATPGGKDASSPYRMLAAAPYLRHLALAVALGAGTEAVLDYVLKARAAAVLQRGPELLAFFAVFHTGMGLLSLAAHTSLTRPVLQSLGLAGTVALRPALVGMAAAAGFVDPRLWSAVLARGCHDVLSNSLFRAGYELLYTPLPEAEKRSAKQVVDVAFDKLGTLVGSAASFAAIRLVEAPDRALLVLAGGFSLAALGLTRRLHRGYVGTLEESLRAGRVRLEPDDIEDSTTRLTLAGTQLGLSRSALLHDLSLLRGGGGNAEAGADATDASGSRVTTLSPADPLLRQIGELRSGKAERIRLVLRQHESTDPALVPHLVPLLARNDLYQDVLRTLRRLAPRATGQLLDTLLDPEADLVVRRRLPRVLKACPTRRALDGLIAAIDDTSREVRSQSALALAVLTRAPGLRVPAEIAFAAARRELERGPDPALEHVFTLLSLVLEPEPLQIAAWALRGPDAALKGTALEYLENVLPGDVRAALWRHVGVAAPKGGKLRTRNEALADLLRSGEGLAAARNLIRRRAFKPRA